MKIQILEKSDRCIKFILEGVSQQFANALRRTAMTEVPTLAIEGVDFHINSSVLYDEIIAHRLGLLTLNFDPKIYNLPSGCNCDGKGCSNCQVILTLNKKGPCMVYAKDFKSTELSVQPTFPETPIIELFENQQLKLEATAILGIGRGHAKWQASKAWYRFWPKAELTGKLDNQAQCIAVCPKNALKINSSATVTPDCDLCGECAKIAEPKVLKISANKTKFIFTLESISGLGAEEIILKAIDILNKKAKELEKGLK